MNDTAKIPQPTATRNQVDMSYQAMTREIEGWRPSPRRVHPARRCDLAWDEMQPFGGYQEGDYD